MDTKKPYVRPVFEKQQRLSDVTEKGATVTGVTD